MKRTTLLLVLTALMVLFGLTACERPAPDSVVPPTAAPGVPGLNATLLPPVAASPTPALAPTLDPNAILPSATPDPAAPPVEPTPEAPAPEAPAEPEQQTSPTGEIIHIVVAGDNLYRIGLRYGFTYQELAAYNSIANPDRLEIGQQIRIPPTP